MSLLRQLHLLLLIASTASSLISPHHANRLGQSRLPSNNLLPLHRTCATGTLDGRYWYLSLLGYGSASSVLKAQSTTKLCHSNDVDQSGTGRNLSDGIVAIKIYDSISSHESWDAYHREIVNEYETMRTLGHPNIVEAYELIQQGPRSLLVMEYCTTSLVALLSSSEISRPAINEIYGKVLRAVHHMHKHGFAHRDIKFENILLCNGDFKLADIGSAMRFRDDKGRTVMTKNIEGTEVFMAPELVQDTIIPYRADQVDIWALGVFYLSLVMGRYPWEFARKEDNEFSRFLDKNDEEGVINVLDSGAKQIVERMLVEDADQRANWTEILENPWVQEIISSNSEDRG